MRRSFVANHLHVLAISWNCVTNPWHSLMERNTSGFTSEFAEVLKKLPLGIFNSLTAAEGPINKSVFITLLPCYERSLLIYSIMTVKAKDFLGVFAREITLRAFR